MWHYIIPPLIGAVIGYCTNYIAVKMLFRPRNEIKVLGHTLPFTPGAIPKNKPRLAKAIGEVVETTFFGEETISAQFLSGEAEDNAVAQMVRGMDRPISDLGISVLGSEEKYEKGLDRLSEILSQQLLQSLRSGETIRMVSDTVIDKLVDQFRGGMLGMFITDSFVESAKQMVEAGIQGEIEDKGEEFLNRMVRSQMDTWSRDTLSEIAFEAGYSDERVERILRKAYRGAVKSAVPALIDRINVSGMIEEKVNDMSNEQLEELVLSVMKRELNLIVNLGALIGLILGCLNLLF
ncbi:MAG: DUF445 family protein [Clostridia bacterium]|uniref:DUF445 domain-containing protein n=1 Tax=Mogibacterium TaxID=86331 RepID=UPI002409D5AB|nr:MULTISPECIES: DUF445 family protein [Mogibacterium]MCI7124503.1 DUF445 family protein [Mogibacterium sp.]MDD6699995.1 DUF445 family protein [Mogibacterium kristiansenii]MDY5450258.1 DUF445 family protein [Clostridia bacterium]